MFRGGGVLDDPKLYKDLLPGMRIVLDEMVSDPSPLEKGTQGTITGRDDIGDCHMEWDNGSELKLLENDRYHIVTTQEELEKSFEHLRKKQEKDYNICPRCGKTFDVRRGAVSRRINKLNIMICDLCGQQEAIEDFILNSKKYDTDVNIFVPAGNNQTGYKTKEKSEQNGKQKIDVKIKPISDWHIVKVWRGVET